MREQIKKMNNSSGEAVFLKKHKGFSLLEVVMAIFIFSLIMVASVSVFVSAFHARIAARKSQKGLEESRTAMETIAKNIRMSTKVANFSIGATNTVRMFNLSQGQCIAYEEVSNVLKSIKYIPSDPDPASVGYPDCETVPPTTDVLLSSGADVTFMVTPTVITAGSQVVGKATVLIKLTTGTMVDRIQTTTSFRDYKDILY
jgi:prepilin-type N-terminal cleavage/methylation domain-containing protein